MKKPFRQCSGITSRRCFSALLRDMNKPWTAKGFFFSMIFQSYFILLVANLAPLRTRLVTECADRRDYLICPLRFRLAEQIVLLSS